MINWDEFEHIHVIKKLKEILNAWWNIDVIFTDERGKIRGMDLSENSSQFASPAVRAFLQKSLLKRAWPTP
jgi:two-component system response regulator HupR/HoxA